MKLATLPLLALVTLGLSACTTAGPIDPPASSTPPASASVLPTPSPGVTAGGVLGTVTAASGKPGSVALAVPKRGYIVSVSNCDGAADAQLEINVRADPRAGTDGAAATVNTSFFRCPQGSQVAQVSAERGSVPESGIVDVSLRVVSGTVKSATATVTAN